MKLSIHPNIKGKPKAGDPILLKLGYNWQSIEADWSVVFDLITVDGYASSSELVADHRCNEEFVSRQLFMVDIDNGMTIPELFEDDLYNICGAGFYASPSFTEELHKFRIMFITPEPITNETKCKALIRGLMKMYKDHDPQCKDAARLFYGTPNCVLKERTDRIMPQEVVDALIQEGGEEIIAPATESTLTPDQANNMCGQLLQLIKKSRPNLNYNDWTTITWAVAHSTSPAEAIAMMNGLWPEMVKGEYRNLLGGKQPANGYRIGTLCKIAKECDELRALHIMEQYREVKTTAFEPLSGTKSGYGDKYKCRTNYSNANYGRREGY